MQLLQNMLTDGCICLLSPRDISQHTEHRTDKPSKTCSPPDAPHADGRNQNHQHRKEDTGEHLHHAVDEGKQRVAHAVEHAAGHIDQRQENVEPAGDAQRRAADGQCLLRGAENAQQRTGRELKQQHTRRHNGNGNDHRQADGLFHAIHTSCAVVVGNNGHHTVVQAENGHKDEALQLEIGAEHRRGRLGEADEDLVHRKGHHRSDGLHNDGRHAHLVNISGGRAVPADILPADVDVRIVLQVEVQRQQRRHDLTQHGSHRRAGNLQPGETAQAED